MADSRVERWSGVREKGWGKRICESGTSRAETDTRYPSRVVSLQVMVHGGLGLRVALAYAVFSSPQQLIKATFNADGISAPHRYLSSGGVYHASLHQGL